MMETYDFEPGQKVWFLGHVKAKVADEHTFESFHDGIVESEWDLWAVPIIVKGSNVITIAHVDDLIHRGKW